MTNRRPQPERRPPHPRLAGTPEERDEERKLIEEIVLPGLQQLAEELNTDPTLTARVELGKGHGASAFIHVERELPAGGKFDAFFCLVYPQRTPFAMVAAAAISPTIVGGRPSSKTRDVPSLTFGRSHLSAETTPEQVRDAIRAEYEKTTAALRKVGYAPAKEGQ